MASLHPTVDQVMLYARLMRQYGHRPEWQKLTKARTFEAMPSHRAAEHLQHLLKALTGKSAPIPCGCSGNVFGVHVQHKHPEASPGARDGRPV